MTTCPKINTNYSTECPEDIYNFPARTVFCHPDDEWYMKRIIKSDDITLLTSTYLQLHHFVASKDVVKQIGEMKMGYANSTDFEKGDMTVVIDMELH